MNEFDVIAKYFRPLTQGHAAAAGLMDDCAVLDIPAGYELVVTSDTLNEDVHFMAGQSAEMIAHKALRVNLSDLASMGAQPFCYQLNIAFPNPPDEKWLAEFTGALLKDQKTYKIFCSGGDTTKINGDYLSISITAMGIVPSGRGVRRISALAGDKIVITGPVGDAYLGLKILRGEIKHNGYGGAVERYCMPEPRVKIAELVKGYANAGADISDGLLADCRNIAVASNLVAEINSDEISFSDDVCRALEGGLVTWAEMVSGGDDYELILSVCPANLDVLMAGLQSAGLSPQVIGEFKDGGGDLLLRGSKALCIDEKALGWTHF